MAWGVMHIKSKETNPDGSFKFTADYLPDEKDFKTPPKITWLSKDAPLVKADLVEFDYLLKTPKVEDGDELLDVLNPNSKFPVACYVDPMIRTMNVRDFLQFERRGYYKIDSIKEDGGDFHYELFYVPDGKKKGLASISRQTDVKGDIKRLDLDEKIEQKKNKDQKNQPPKEENKDKK